ncbi:hypothetical protein [Spirosoma foliorum]|uniref:Uncharacterized protein n=1 Tax=Spirosoma foliorum TaxID=2710596 RepID=A0A7G5H6N8_9BACT|nr:hypothetical protein [Spirosoma foliorum]QMW06780.1 hypothetical protein H3H32_18740 [Spirosoma foliorum]
MSYFYDYYQRVIYSTTSEPVVGLKLVLGGTGLGKTTGIKEVIQQHPVDDPRQFMYVTNRVQLLDEMLKSVPSAIYLKRDAENLIDVLLKEEIYLLQFFNHPIVTIYLEQINDEKPGQINLPLLRQYTDYLIKEPEYVRNNPNDEVIARRVGYILRAVKLVFYQIRQVETLAKQQRPKNKEQISLCQEHFSQLVQLEMIGELFPFIRFKYGKDKNGSSHKLLLITVQKAFHGFFDGKRIVNLENLSAENNSGKYVLFLDEFDFLETDLANLICADNEIANPFDFVESFYSRLRRNKLPVTKYLQDRILRRRTLYKRHSEDESIELIRERPRGEISQIVVNRGKDRQVIWQKEEKGEFKRTIKVEHSSEDKNILGVKQSISIRYRIRQIIKKVDKLADQTAPVNQQINFPQINHFICTDRAIRGKSIFQTSISIVAKPIYLDERRRANSFNLHSERTEQSKSAFHLFQTVRSAAIDVLRLLKEVSLKYPSLYPELVRQCFGDLFYSSAINMLNTIHQQPPTRLSAPTDYDKLHQNGLSLYEIQKNVSAESDREEVAFRHLAVYLTPERILRSLIKHNLVFGLSATADIDRLLRNFDVERYLRQQDGLVVFPFTNEDEDTIRKANDAKQNGSTYNEGRKNRIGLALAEELSNDHSIAKFLDNVAETNEAIFDKGNTRAYRLKRLKHFFSTLLWIKDTLRRDDPGGLAKDSHLLFYHTYKHIQFLFKNQATRQLSIPDERRERHLVYSIKELPNKETERFSYYELTLYDQSFIVVFYDSALGRTLNKIEENNYEKLFWEQKPVIVITQYASAGNGINPQYYPDLDSKTAGPSALKDFKNIHLLDSPHFYFSDTNPDQLPQENNSIIKRNAYNLAKLFHAGAISEREIKSYLDNIRRGNFLNETYKSTEDGILNQLAVFVQAIGRIERVWSQMADQTIRLDRDVYKVFAQFVGEDRFAEALINLRKHCSNNVRLLLKYIEASKEQIHYEIANVIETTLGNQESRCRTSLQQFVRFNLEQFRVGNSAFNDARDVWENLRQVALKQDFSHKLLERFSGTFQSKYFYKGRLFYDKNSQVIPYHLWSNDFIEWEINSLYYPVIGNDLLRKHFNRQGFPMEFLNREYFFTPYFWQAILSGVIGEEAIRVLLAHELGDNIFEEITDSLFEIADLKLRNVPFYVDCKNYSEATLQQFELESDDPLVNPRFKLSQSHFQANAQRKWHLLQRYHKTNRCKLIFINFIGHSERLLHYFDQNWQETSFDRARYVIVQGVLNRDGQNRYEHYCNGFRQFITDLQNTLTN